jgi:hypothetical protein
MFVFLLLEWLLVNWLVVVREAVGEVGLTVAVA